MMADNERAFHGRSVDLYDVFVDWPGRLSREIPALIDVLNRHKTHKVLDVGCGTARHAATLREAGYQVHAADASEDMVSQAVQTLSSDEGVYQWALGETIPTTLAAHAPFDALVCLGNTWSQVIGDAAISSACSQCYSLLRPGGFLLVGLKALAERKQAGDPYMPLLKRQHEGRDLFFVRFVDFCQADPNVCNFHMLVAGEGLYTVSPMRVWSTTQLQTTFSLAGFEPVRISARIEDSSIRPSTEDVWVHAIKP